mgnify:CR=1 FL=1
MARLTKRAVALLLLAAAACHPGPILTPKEGAGGTVAGIVSTTAKRRRAGPEVTAVNVTTGARFDATTGPNGGYTIKVPEGTYRLELELRPGETIAKQPSETKINKSDLDPHRDFTIAGKSLSRKSPSSGGRRRPPARPRHYKLVGPKPVLQSASRWRTASA